MKKIIITFTLLCAIVYSQKSFSQSKAEIAYYNIGLGSLVGGIGAIINKESNEKTGKVFLKGFLQGGLGGYLVYESKNILLKIPEKNKLEYAWGGKILNSMGSSIIENSAMNRGFGDRWHMNIGFSRFEIHTKDKIKFKHRVMPISLLLMAIYASGNKFELDKSLKTGEIIFSVAGNYDHAGAAWGKLILIHDSNLNNFNTISHEIVHSYQYEDFNFVNCFLNKPISKLLDRSKLGQKLNKILYFDVQAPVFGGLYLLENGGANYYDNFFEYEAGIFSNTLDLD